MIELTRLNGKQIIINSDLIESVEENPDTVVTLVNGKKIIVRENKYEVKELVKSYKREVMG